MKFVADPVFWIWIGVIATAFAFAAKRRRLWAAVFLGCAVLGSAVEALKIPARLLAGLERPYLRTDPLPDGPVDAVVVPGGYIRELPGTYLGFEVNEHFDRLLAAVALMRHGKAQTLVLGGATLSNEQAATNWIRECSLVSTPVQCLGDCSNTHDEAVRSKVLAQRQSWKRVILVTSAWHLKRAEGAFRKEHLEVLPVGCDFQGTTALADNLTVIPGTASLVLFRLWLEETIGYAYYRLRGWA